MVEVKQHGAVFAHLHHGAGVLPQAIGRGELHHIASAVLLVRVAQLVHQLARHPLHHVGVALAKGDTGRQLKGGVRAFGQADQLLFHGGRQLACAQRQRGGLFVEGVDHVTGRAG